jgi:chromosomal replication initiation ATPase DnaA
VKPRQIPLDLAGAPSFGREDFLVAPSNAKPWALFENWPDWPDRTLALVGPSGSGKTHLATIWAIRAGACVLRADAMGREAAECAGQAGAALVEDADRVLGAEADLFHFLNRARSENLYVVFTARTRPDAWRLRTPDLVSRLRQAPVILIGEPDEALMRAVLVKLFVDRQLIVDVSVLEFVALRLERSLDAARRFVEAVDLEALARSRPITRPMAAEVLRSMESVAG